MGVVLVPSLLWLQSGWWTGNTGGRARVTVLILLVIFGLGLGTAIVAAVALTRLGPVAGAVACAALLVAVFHPKGAAGLLFRRFPLDTPTGTERGATVGTTTESASVRSTA
jgi:hypothetical protein